MASRFVVVTSAALCTFALLASPAKAHSPFANGNGHLATASIPSPGSCVATSALGAIRCANAFLIVDLENRGLGIKHANVLFAADDVTNLPGASRLLEWLIDIDRAAPRR